MQTLRLSPEDLRVHTFDVTPAAVRASAELDALKADDSTGGPTPLTWCRQCPW